MIPLIHFVGRDLVKKGMTLAVMESCTGGFICSEITSLPGCSRYFQAGCVAYSNEEKTRAADVPAEMFIAHGAVSEPVARAMAEGFRAKTGATYTMALTGIAGPTGGSEAKPVGTVWIALAGPDGTVTAKHLFPGVDRDMYREATARAAFVLLANALSRNTQSSPISA